MNFAKNFALLATAACMLAQPALASPEAEAIVEKMLAQKADLLKQAPTYIVKEKNDFGSLQKGEISGSLDPTLLYSDVCNLDRLAYVTKDGRTTQLALDIAKFCYYENPVGHSIVRPKEIEYMILQGRYEDEKELSKIYPVMSEILFAMAGTVAIPLMGGDANTLGFALSSVKKQTQKNLKDHFNLEDLQRDIVDALQEQRDLEEFGKVAKVVGEVEVEGRPAWALVADNLDRKQVTEDGEFIITAAALAVDKQHAIQRAMFVEGYSTEGKKKKEKQRFAIMRKDLDLRPIEGTTAYIPYESQMLLSMKVQDKESQRELEQARKEYEEAKKQLEQMQLAGAIAGSILNDQIKAQFDKMEAHLKMLEEGAKADLNVAEMTAEIMQRFLNEPVGMHRQIEYARKGDVLDYLAALQGKEIDRDALKAEMARWEAEKRAADKAREAKDRAADAAREKELEELRKQNEDN